MVMIPLVDLKAQYKTIRACVDEAIQRVIDTTAFINGPDVAAFEGARTAALQPQKIEDTLMIMVESRYPFAHTKLALDADFRIDNAGAGWAGFKKRFPDGD